MLKPVDIKRALHEAGFEVYRTRAETVHVAERARENLIMDSGVRVRCEELAVAFYARAQRGDFPEEDDEALFARARVLGEAAVKRGYREARTFVTLLPDPGDPNQTLDRWCQVQFEKSVGSLEDVIAEVEFACALDKLAKR